MRFRNHHHDRSRSGFTLLELLIVLMILVTVISLSLPSLRGSLDKSRLTAGAKDVQAALAKARSLAVREATLVQFRFEPGGRKFVIERCPTPAAEPVIVLDQGETSSSQSTSLGARIGNNNANTNSDVTDSDSTATGTDPQTTILREGELPVGVIFADESLRLDSNVGNSGTETVADSIAQGVPTSGMTSGRGLSERWSVPVIFSPSGRTRSRNLVLQGQRDFYIDVYLRGLTSSASYSAPRKRAAMNGVVLPDDNSSAVEQGAE